MSAGIFSTNLLIAAKLPGQPEEKLTFFFEKYIFGFCKSANEN